MTKQQQAPRLPPYSYRCTSYTLWDCCRSSKHVDQTTVPGTVTKVYENATRSPQDCNLIHALAHNTVPGTAAVLRTTLTKQYRGPLPGFTRMLHAVPKSVTIFICEYGDSPGACCLVTLIQKTTAVPGTVLCTTV